MRVTKSDAARALKQFERETRHITTEVVLHVLGRVRKASSISRAVKTQVEGFDLVIENTTIRHTLQRHGNAAMEARRGQIAVTSDDIRRLPQLLQEFDTAERVDDAKQGALQVRLRKRLSGIDYEVFAEVRLKARHVAFKTMIKRRTREASSGEPPC